MKIRGFKIKLRKREILRNLKYTSKVKPLDTKIEDAVQQQIENGYSLLYPSVIYNTYHSASDEFLKVKEIFLNSKKVTGLLDNSSAFTLMVITIGKKLEEEVDKLKKKDLTSAFILDSVGSEASEKGSGLGSEVDISSVRTLLMFAAGGWQLIVGQAVPDVRNSLFHRSFSRNTVRDSLLARSPATGNASDSAIFRSQATGLTRIVAKHERHGLQSNRQPAAQSREDCSEKEAGDLGEK